MIDVLRALAYPLPGLALTLLAIFLARAARRAAAHPAAPRWARRYAAVTIPILFVGGTGLTAIGLALSAIILGG